MTHPARPPKPHSPRRRTAGARTAAVRALAATVLLVASPAGATAHADEPMSPRAAVLVEQAISLIANEASQARVLTQIDDALAAPDKSGVDLAGVRQARDVAGASPASDGMRRARALLLASVGGHLPSAPEAGRPATGDETGTSVILDEFRPARGISNGGDAALFGLGLAAVGAGIWLSRRLRPRHTLRQLEHRGPWKGKQ